VYLSFGSYDLDGAKSGKFITTVLLIVELFLDFNGDVVVNIELSSSRGLS
jgi:hypothetical protein